MGESLLLLTDLEKREISGEKESIVLAIFSVLIIVIPVITIIII